MAKANQNLEGVWLLKDHELNSNELPSWKNLLRKLNQHHQWSSYHEGANGLEKIHLLKVDVATLRWLLVNPWKGQGCFIQSNTIKFQKTLGIYSTLRIKCKYERISVINGWLIVCVPGACWNYVGFNLFNKPSFSLPYQPRFFRFFKKRSILRLLKGHENTECHGSGLHITSIKSHTYWLKLVLKLPPPPPLSFQTWPGLKGGFTHLIWEICQTTSNSLSKSCIPVTICWTERHHILIILQAIETQND